MGQPLKLSEEDFKQFGGLLEGGILKKIDEEMLRSAERNGVVTFSCCDGDHFDCKREHFKKVFGCGRVHPPALPGGPVILSHPSLQIHRPTAIWAIEAMILKKKAHTVGLCSHGPCAMALDLGLNFTAVVNGLTEAKKILRACLEMKCQADAEMAAILGEKAERLEILRFVHVDRTPFGKKKGTYFVDNHLS